MSSSKQHHLRKATKLRGFKRSLIFLSILFVLIALLVFWKQQQDVSSLSLWNDDPAAVDNTAITSTRVTDKNNNNWPTLPRFITVIIPSVVDPQLRQRRLDSIAATWANANSRALFVVHNLTSEYPNNPFPVVVHNGTTTTTTSTESRPTSSAFPHILLLPSNITESHGFDRLEYVIRYVYNQFDPDYIFLVNDHTFVIPQNVCLYLKDRNPNQQDLYAGRAMMNPGGQIFNSGAAGYIMSRRTMKRLLVEAWDVGKCLPTAEWMKNNPDLVIASCFQHELNISAEDTRDHANNKRQHRFHSYGIVRTVLAEFDDWYYKVHDRFDGTIRADLFDESYRTIPSGEECCSSETLSFHYVEYAETRVLHDLLHNKELLASSSSQEHLSALIQERWPHPSTLGGYSRRLPMEGDGVDVQKFWADFVAVIRKMSPAGSTGTSSQVC